MWRQALDWGCPSCSTRSPGTRIYNIYTMLSNSLQMKGFQKSLCQAPENSHMNNWAPCSIDTAQLCSGGKRHRAIGICQFSPALTTIPATSFFTIHNKARI
ncbi:protein of unknown function [Ralstonia solanacearum CMR15]|nr:protein of unknown function [Ralstonia solanacearum CMR15]